MQMPTIEENVAIRVQQINSGPSNGQTNSVDKSLGSPRATHQLYAGGSAESQGVASTLHSNRQGKSKADTMGSANFQDS